MSREKVQNVIVCAPAMASYVVEGSVYHHTCMQCGGHVALAPSGQAALAKNPEVLFICLPCLRHKRPDMHDTIGVLPGALDELKDWLGSLINYHAGRDKKQ